MEILEHPLFHINDQTITLIWVIVFIVVFLIVLVFSRLIRRILLKRVFPRKELNEDVAHWWESGLAFRI